MNVTKVMPLTNVLKLWYKSNLIAFMAYMKATLNHGPSLNGVSFSNSTCNLLHQFV